MAGIKNQNQTSDWHEYLAEIVATQCPRVWDAIGYDYMECADGSTISSAEFVEACIDANRLTTFLGKEGKEAEEAVDLLMQDLKYPEMLKLIGSKTGYDRWGC